MAVARLVGLLVLAIIALVVGLTAATEYDHWALAVAVGAAFFASDPGYWQRDRGPK